MSHSSQTALGALSGPGPVIEPGFCWVCSCTDFAACPGGCWWVPDPTGRGDLCSECLTLALAYDEVAKHLTDDAALTAEELAALTGIASLAIHGFSPLEELVLHDLLVVDRKPRPPRYTLNTQERSGS